ncbi:MAG: type II toxin-antitoxin system RelE/ParE family toxin [Xanthobacteraceae bacterium]
MLVFHGFIKKTQKTPDDELALARKRKREFNP